MTKITITSDVLFQALDNEAVLLHLPTEKYFGLNEVGSQMWQLLEAGSSMEDTISSIMAEYEVEEEMVRRDIAELVSQLAEQELIQIEV